MNRTMKSGLLKLLLWALVVDMALFPTLASAKSRLSGYVAGRSLLVSTPDATALPVLKADEYTDGVVEGVSSIDTTVIDDSASMEIQQTQTNIVINWDSFNIGENASVTFNQESSNWSALNRIWDANPSAIFGQLSATGRIFLINQNGVVFGENSRVNVHTLVATSLDMDDDTFLDGSWKDGSIDLEANNYQEDDDYDALAGEIVNQGYIAADSTGAIFLVGPTVTNEGTIEAPVGQVGLVAGTDVSLSYPDDNESELYRSISVASEGSGTATNTIGAKLSAKMGLAGMYGSVVNQEGLIKTVTALEQNGQIELLATERIKTGAKSQILAEISTSDDAYDENYEINTSKITMGGLGDSTATTVLPDEIVLNGEITAPGALVTIKAENAVTLTSGAIIDVSGGWSKRSASENELEVQLNSVELSDAFYVRQGELLGSTIYVNALEGTTLAHIDGYLSEDLTAKQRFTEGGTVNITAEEGSITIDDGATIDFSGGGYHYTSGEVQISYVRLGNQIWDVSEVPEWALEQGDQLELLGDDEVRRLGLAATRTIQAYDEGHDAGTLTLETASITLKGELDGSVTRGVYQDSASEPIETVGDIDYQTARGRETPTAGTLRLGSTGESLAGGMDYFLGNVTITEDNADSDEDTTYISAEIINAAELSEVMIYANGSIAVDSDAVLTLAEGGEFSATAARILHQGAIYAPGGHITLKSEYTIDAGFDEYIYVDSGSVLSVAGTQIDYSLLSASVADYYGSDLLDGGTITITGNYQTTDYILIHDGSLLDVSGGYAIDPDGSEAIGGDAGELEVTAMAVIFEGEIRGYSLVSQDGGSLTLQAANLVVANDIADLPQTADEFTVGSALPDDFTDTLYVSAEQIQGSGFSDITLLSLYSPDLAADLSLSPSTVKYSLPLYLRRTLRDPRMSITPVYYEVDEDYLEASSLTIKANQTLSDSQNVSVNDALIDLAAGASLSVTTGGAITMEAPRITIDGSLTALGGTADLTTGDNGYAATGILVGEGAEIRVQGCLSAQADGWESGTFLYYQSEGGGSVILESLYGSVNVADGATIDVSGGDAVVNTYYLSTGIPVSQTLAGDAGDLTVTAEEIVIDAGANLIAATALSGSEGGDLTLAHTDLTALFELDLLLLQQCQENGFDAITIQSVTGVELQYSGDTSSGDTVSLYIARQLVVDTPLITTTAGLSWDLYAPYVQVINTLEKYQALDLTSLNSYLAEWSDLTRSETDASLTLSGLWLDMTGQVAIDGITELSLAFVYDIQLADQYGRYNSTTEEYSDYAGGLMTLADLTISADRIYPASEAAFTIQNGYLDDDGQWTGGEYLTISGPGDYADRSEGSIYSAGGTLEIVSNAITLSDARLAAPMGQILLSGVGDDSSILVADGSILTAGSGEAVSYGEYTDGEWQQQAKDDDAEETITDVESAPERAVSLTADTVVTEEGTEIDVSGGGTIYAYEFSASVSGSADPLNTGTRYVILANNSVQLPGLAVYLEGVAGLADGWYSLLPESYAFVDGAIIIEDLGTVDAADIPSSTSAGDAITIGQLGYMGTGITTGQAHLYSVRLASAVLEEGQYDGAYITAGDGGTLIAQGTSTTLSGTVTAAGLDDYSGGTAVLSATNIYVGDTPDAETLGLDNLLLLGADFFADAGFAYVQLGAINTDDDDLTDGENQSLEEGLEAFEEATGDDFSLWSQVSGSDNGSTQAIIIEEGALSADAIGLFALDSIEIGESTSITAEELLLVTAGTLDIAVGAVTDTDGGATATISVDRLGIFADVYDLSGTPEVSQLLALGSACSLALVRDATDIDAIASTSLVIDETVWQTFAAIPDITLVGASGITVYDGIDLDLEGDLEVHTSSLALQSTDGGQSETDGDKESLWRAENITLYGLATTAVDVDDGKGSGKVLNLEAGDTLSVYGGDLDDEGDPDDVIQFQGLSELYLAATNDMVFGVGRLETGDSDLTLTAARITSTYERDGDGDYQVGEFTIDAGSGTVRTLSSGTDADSGDLVAPGGALTITADTIVHGGVIDILGGQVTLSSTGLDGDAGVYLTAGSEILAKGGAQSYDIAGEEVIDVVAGGVVTIESASGIFEMAGADATDAEAEAIIDVSNAYAGDDDAVGYDLIAAATDDDRETWAASGLLDAGTVVLDVAGDDEADNVSKSVVLHGTVLGMAAGSDTKTWGSGGDFSLDAHAFDLDDVADLLDDSGFESQILLRARNGDLALGSGSTLTASRIQVVADDGAITIAGILDTSGRVDDRSIALYASGTLTLAEGSLLDASGTDSADGGDVTLSSTNDWVYMLDGSTIDVCGADGGTVTFVAGRYHVDGDEETTDDVLDGDSADDDVKIDLYGTIIGASRLTAEAVASYAATEVDTSVITDCKSETSDYMQAAETYGVQGILTANLTLIGLDGETLSSDEALDLFHLTPHVALYSTGDLELSSDWVLSGISGSGSTATEVDDWRYGDDREAGVLTLRAVGDLIIDGNLADEAQDDVQLVFDSQSSDSWSYNLVAGADLSSADIMAVNDGTGDLVVTDGNQVYTESGGIRFAAGNDVNVGRGAVIYGAYGDLSATISTYDGDITGSVGRDLVLAGDTSTSSATPAAIQSNTGAITLVVGRDVDLSGTGTAIRTLGALTDTITIDDLLNTIGNSARGWDTAWGDDWEDWQVLYGEEDYTAFTQKLYGYITNALNNNFWLYGEGGSISIHAGRDVLGNDDADAGWMALYASSDDDIADPLKYTAAYTNDDGNTFSGIGTLGGGDITIAAGRDVYASVGNFGEGDMVVLAGGDLDGRYLVNDGWGALTAMGSFGSHLENSVIELGHASLNLSVQGDAYLGTVLNPVFTADFSFDQTYEDNYYIDYDEESEVRVTALTGDLTITGDSHYHTTLSARQTRLLPPRVFFTAGQDISIMSATDLVLAPSAAGVLSLVVGRNIQTDEDDSTYGWIVMSAAAPEMYYTDYFRIDGYSMKGDLAELYTEGFEGFTDDYVEAFLDMWEELDDEKKEDYRAIYDRITGDLALHEKDLDSVDAADIENVIVKAGEDIIGLKLSLPMAAEISAGNDIVNLYLNGQNNNGANEENGYVGDVTSIIAGGDISLNVPLNEVQKAKNSGNLDISKTGLILSGPGWMIVSAGGSIDLGATQGIQTIGQDDNDRLDATVPRC